MKKIFTFLFCSLYPVCSFYAADEFVTHRTWDSTGGSRSDIRSRVITFNQIDLQSSASALVIFSGLLPESFYLVRMVAKDSSLWKKTLMVKLENSL